MVWLLVGGAALIIACLWFGGKAERGHVDLVADDTAAKLKARGESEDAIKSYLNSKEFDVHAKSSFGRMSVSEAGYVAVDQYLVARTRWTGIGEEYIS